MIKHTTAQQAQPIYLPSRAVTRTTMDRLQGHPTPSVHNHLTSTSSLNSSSTCKAVLHNNSIMNNINDSNINNNSRSRRPQQHLFDDNAVPITNRGHCRETRRSKSVSQPTHSNGRYIWFTKLEARSRFDNQGVFWGPYLMYSASTPRII